MGRLDIGQLAGYENRPLIDNVTAKGAAYRIERGVTIGRKMQLSVTWTNEKAQLRVGAGLDNSRHDVERTMIRRPSFG